MVAAVAGLEGGSHPRGRIVPLPSLAGVVQVAVQRNDAGELCAYKKDRSAGMCSLHVTHAPTCAH
eukprot:5231291-Amphidinium_carterae.1